MTEPDRAFARIKLEGRRYTGGRLPISSLDELKRYQELVLEAARMAWNERNGEPPPADFATSLQLALAEIQDGSAVSVLERAPSMYDEYFDAGRDELDRELAGALAGVPYEELPLLGIPAFSDFGSSLEPDEYLEIARSGHGRPVLVTEEITREVFRPLAGLWHRRNQEIPPDRHTETEWIVGRLTALDADRKNYTIKIQDRYVNGRFKDPEVLDDLKAVLDSSETAPLVRFLADARYQGERLLNLLDMKRVQVLEIDGQPWSRRFIELGSLQAGWHDENPHSAPIAFSALDGARAVLTFINELGLPLPGLFPLDDGGVNVEWATPTRVVSVEIAEDGEFFAYSNDRVQSEIHDLTSTNIEDIKDFIRKVRF